VSMSRTALLAGVLSLFLLPCSKAAAPAVRSEPLHVRIDRLIGIDQDFARYDAGLASDSEFLRRVHIDLAGYIPTSAQIRAFLADSAPDKRRRVIEQLLNSPEYARNMAQVFDVLLMERRPSRHVPQADWHEFLRQAFLNNRPWDEVVREILSGDGTDPKKRHRIKFFLERDSDPHLVSRDISRLLLGMNLQCAQCHDHPRIEDYRQEHYYGLFAFVSRTTAVQDKNKKLLLLSEKADGETTYQSVFDPKKITKTAVPRVPFGPALVEPLVDKAKLYVIAPAADVAAVPTFSRLARLAGAITQRDYLPFRRNLANRLWAHLMGRGLFEPFDNDHSANPPSHPEVLDLLAQELADNGFNIRAILRELALTKTYQRSSIPRPGTDAKQAPLYAIAVVKPLSPEQLAWSVMQATGLLESYRKAYGGKDPEGEAYRRLAPSAALFINAFANPPGQPQTFEPRTDQALLLANHPSLRSWLAPGSTLATRLNSLPLPTRVEELYLSVLGRLPDEEERKEATEFLTRQPKDIGDLAWALLTSPEFRFNH
jgi:hypothetical protein